jgi:glyoxylase-like metal-dependent hydrolase (beta-lactamase superfamily II)
MRFQKFSSKISGIHSLLVSLFIATSMSVGTGATARTLETFTTDSSGFDTHTYWYDDGHEVTIFDTQFLPTLTTAMIEQIKSRTNSPITRVIVTHPNPDKFNGLPVLHALGAESISSKTTADAMSSTHEYKKYFWTRIAKSFSDETYPRYEPVKTTFSGRRTITLRSGETLTLFELSNAGVSSTQTVVRIDRTGDLIVGDLVHHKAHLWLEGGIIGGKATPNLRAWSAALSELATLTTDKAKVFGGRGSVGTLAEVVPAAQAYLRKADDIVNAYISSAPKADLVNPAKAEAHYAELQKRFEAAFPAYPLGYLVRYGVYGLVNSKL